MGGLGIVLLWAGYTTGMFGYAKIKSAYGLAPTLSISDLALPSHRSTYLAAFSGATTPAPAASTSTGATAATAPVPIPGSSGPVARGATGGAALGRTAPPSLTPVPTPSGPYTP